MSNWWLIENKELNPIWVIDANTTVNNKKELVNNVDLTMVALSVKNKISIDIETTSGYKSNLGYNTNTDVFQTYRSINIKDNLLLNKPLHKEAVSTLIFKGVVRKGTVFTSGENSQSFHGLTYSYDVTSNNSDTYTCLWRAHSLSPKSPDSMSYQERISGSISNSVQTIVLKSDKETSRVEMWVNGKLMPYLGHSTAYFTNNDTYAMPHDIYYLGYNITSTQWDFNVDVIGWAMYNSWLEDEDIDVILNQLEAQAFVSEVQDFSPFKINTRGNLRETPHSYNNQCIGIDWQKTKLKLNVKTANIFYKHLKPFSNNNDMLFYKDSINIADVVLKEGVPYSTIVYLYERYSGRLLSTTVSDIEGNFKFINLKKGVEYVVTTNDKDHMFRSIIKNYEKGQL